MTPTFVDSNVLIYSAVDHPNEVLKSVRAREIVSGADWACSVQVLQEFYHQVTRRSRPSRLSHTQAMELVTHFRQFPIQEMTLDIFLAATQTTHRYQLAYWDAAIVEAARALGCHTILTEDLPHGQDFGGLSVVNPFR